ncbi:Ultraviolet-B receptor UVR8 [Apostasia shenzhenica]|uniref:Ultraviolet-B receptor UVR8 n=1 Tax=Apostasia shenzhenica TaxID=1088818 RepID=A0A2I0AGB2_9ASPA|nr:Ultraviolet-B receptor UVR8 [Apostasia shenzhenica]
MGKPAATLRSRVRISITCADPMKKTSSLLNTHSATFFFFINSRPLHYSTLQPYRRGRRSGKLPAEYVASVDVARISRKSIGDGCVYSWGRGTFGRLGTGREADELVPVRVSFASENGGGQEPNFILNVVLLLDKCTDGQLGHGEDNSLNPQMIEQFKELGAPPNPFSREPNSNQETAPLKVSSIKAGGMMSLAIDNLGGLWIWGNCIQPSTTEGQEEEFSLVSSSSPLPVWDFHGHTVVKVACGNEHVVAAISASETFSGTNLICYAWGNNNHGQLGLGDWESRSRPEPIPTFREDSPWAIYEIACGAFHTAILTHKKSYDQEIESRCWTFGLDDNGQLGHGTTRSESSPLPVNGLPTDAILISLACGLFHTSLVSASGELWSWGMEKGLGLCPDASFQGDDAGDALVPIRIYCSESHGGSFPVPVQVACGAANTILVADDGFKLWAWGRGRSGVLGSGQTNDSYRPAPLMWPAPEKNLEQNYERKASSVHVKMSEKELVETREEMNVLRERLTIMERYATILHVSIFRKALNHQKLPESLGNSGVFDVRSELENLLEASDTDELARMEMFYEGMVSAVKDKLMKRRIQELVKEHLLSLSSGRQPWGTREDSR